MLLIFCRLVWLAVVDVVPLFLEETPESIVDEKDLKISYLSLCEDDQGQKGHVTCALLF